MQGDSDAQYQAGMCYLQGVGIQEDDEEGFMWMMKSAEQGDPDAQSMVGLCYAEGYGVEKDLEKAKAWYVRAAEQGSDTAIKALKKFNL